MAGLCVSAQVHLCPSTLPCGPFSGTAQCGCASTESTEFQTVRAGELCGTVKSECCAVSKTQTQILALPLTSHVILDTKILSITEPRGPHL